MDSLGTLMSNHIWPKILNISNVCRQHHKIKQFSSDLMMWTSYHLVSKMCFNRRSLIKLKSLESLNLKNHIQNLIYKNKVRDSKLFLPLKWLLYLMKSITIKLITILTIHIIKISNKIIFIVVSVRSLKISY